MNRQTEAIKQITDNVEVLYNAKAENIGRILQQDIDTETKIKRAADWLKSFFTAYFLGRAGDDVALYDIMSASLACVDWVALAIDETELTL